MNRLAVLLALALPATAHGADTVPPQLTIVKPAPATQFLKTRTIDLRLTSNEALSAIDVNGTSLQLSSNKKTATGTLTLPQDGPVTLAWSARDLAGNLSTLSQSLTVDATKPVFSVSPAPAELTNASSLNLAIQVTDTTAVTAGEPLVLRPIRLDTKVPKFSKLQPGEGKKVPSLAFEYSGVASEPLASLKLEDQPVTLGADGKTFSGTFTAAQAGPITLHWDLQDLAGNTATVTRNLLISPRPAITLGTPDHQRTHQRAFALPVQVDSPRSPTKTVVYHNGRHFLTTTELNFTATRDLVEGPNTFKVVSTNADGVKAIPRSVPEHRGSRATGVDSVRRSGRGLGLRH